MSATLYSIIISYETQWGKKNSFKMELVLLFVSFLLFWQTFGRKHPWRIKGLFGLQFQVTVQNWWNSSGGLECRPSCCLTQHCLQPRSSLHSQRGMAETGKGASCYLGSTLLLSQFLILFRTTCLENGATHGDIGLHPSIKIKTIATRHHHRLMSLNNSSTDAVFSDESRLYKIDR